MLLLVGGLDRRKTVDEGRSLAFRAPPDVLRRVFGFMLHMAGGNGADDAKDGATEHFRDFEDCRVRAMCGGVLAQLGRPAAASSGSTDA